MYVAGYGSFVSVGKLHLLRIEHILLRNRVAKLHNVDSVNKKNKKRKEAVVDLMDEVHLVCSVL